MDRIRNLKSIQVFLIVAEHCNITRAARDLNTSQSAVSYHIGKLEADLGVSLFRRTPRGLDLTEDGASLAADAGRGLAAVRAGLEKIAARADALKVAVLPMFASRWLSQRLGGFWEGHPGLRLSIQNHNNTFARMERPAEFADIGIQWGRGAWPKFEITRLWPERLVVVCSPGYRRAHDIRRPADLGRCTLLHVDDVRMWDEWHQETGVRRTPGQAEMFLEDRHFQLSSTVNGLGVSLFAEWLVQDELRAGALVDPFGRACATTFAYHLIHPRDAPLSRPALQFKRWMLELCAPAAA